MIGPRRGPVDGTLCRGVVSCHRSLGTRDRFGRCLTLRGRRAGFQARDALCAVEGRPPIGWDKGHAVLHVLREKYGPGWSESVRAIYAGDDETDEDAFRGLLGLGATFRVGPPTAPTRARRKLSNVAAVETMLRWIASRPAGQARPNP